MKLKEAFKESWSLTKSNFVLMMTLLSVGLFICALAITPFVGETATIVSFTTGWGNVVLSLQFSLLSFILIQVGFCVAPADEQLDRSVKQVCKNIGQVLLAILVYQFIVTFGWYSIDQVGLSQVSPVWYLVGVGLLILINFFLVFRIGFFTLYIIGYNQSIPSAFRLAWRLSGRKWLGMFGLYLLTILLGFVGVLALVVGLFVAYIIILFLTIIYFRAWTKEESLIQNNN